ncbi:MAG: phosphatase PAP2 family protein [Micromonosporaceae bacterium]|jgi:membrane-associated phospholipid phosphatase
MILRYELVAPARDDMVTARRRTTAAWLVVAAVGQAFAVEAVRRIFVGTVRGQQVDTVALTGGELGHDRVAGLVAGVLDAVSVLSVAFATVAIGIIAVLRRRFLLAAVATGMVVAANVTTQVLKALAHRPEFGVDMARAAVGNSLPSGHTTVTASVAAALVLVLPASLRGIAALAGTGLAALTGVATLSAGWHRPSDAVAALLVVGAWAAVAGLVLVAAGGDPPATSGGPGRRPPAFGNRVSTGGGVPYGVGSPAYGTGIPSPAVPDRAANPNRMTLLALVAVALAASVVALLGLVVTDQVRDTPPEWLSRPRLLAAYAGGAAGITAVASGVMALVLATASAVARPWWPGRHQVGR